MTPVWAALGAGLPGVLAGLAALLSARAARTSAGYAHQRIDHLARRIPLTPPQGPAGTP